MADDQQTQQPYNPAPSSVTAGGSFTLKNITSSAASNLPIIITSSDLKLSATNASKTIYFKANTSSYIDPVTGYRRAVFPDWNLVATGAAGGKVVIKLVEATAHVENVGPIVCPLSETLASVNITAPTNGSGGNSTIPPSGSGTNNPDSNTEDEADGGETDAGTPVTPAQTKNQAQTQSVRIIVKDSKGNFLGGASVRLHNQEVLSARIDGSAVFEGIPRGDHLVKVEHNSTAVHQTIYVSSIDNDNNKTIVVPVESNLSSKMFFAITSSLFALISIFVPRRLF